MAVARVGSPTPLLNNSCPRPLSLKGVYAPSAISGRDVSYYENRCRFDRNVNLTWPFDRNVNLGPALHFYHSLNLPLDMQILILQTAHPSNPSISGLTAHIAGGLASSAALFEEAAAAGLLEHYNMSQVWSNAMTGKVDR